jgi:hypothetical protein
MQVAIGGGHRGDAGGGELMDEAILEGPVETLATAAGRGRVGGEVRDAELGPGAADLGELRAVHGGARLRGVEGPTRANTSWTFIVRSTTAGA